MSLTRYEEAIKDWEIFLQYEPDAADVINTIGLCYRMLKKNQQALQYIDRAIQMNPQGPFYLNRSYAYSALNNMEQARQDALVAKQAGVQLDPSYASALGIK
jgi:tetratricopeptide (TPR) repeat protein